MANFIKTAPGRLACLDILRGMDMFLLTALGAVLKQFDKSFNFEWFKPVAAQLQHKSWTGFSVEDLIMPLFMFCAGVAIPYSLSKYKEPGVSKAKAYWRIGRRLIVLWILGMVVQGNLLDLNPAALKFYSNTLQSIAVGYTFSAIMFMNTKPKTQIITAAGLLVGFWALMMFVKIGDWGGGNFRADGNLAEYIDRVVLGKHIDHATVLEDGTLQYHLPGYTWVLSSMTFCVTVMLGLFSGEILKSEWTEKKKFWTLFGLGAGLTAAGWLWNLQMPVIKHIWTSSMVLVAGGYSLLLLAFCYYVADWKKKRWLHWLIPIGANCMLAYLSRKFIDFRPFTKSIVYGLQQFMSPGMFSFITVLLSQMLFMLCFDLLYKHRKFFRV